jgi:hypothetical protein
VVGGRGLPYPIPLPAPVRRKTLSLKSYVMLARSIGIEKAIRGRVEAIEVRFVFPVGEMSRLSSGESGGGGVGRFWRSRARS